MYAGTDLHPALAALAAHQGGAVRRDQLAAVGVSHDHAAHEVSAQRWSAWGRHVILLQNAPPRRTQLMWIAVLDCGARCALCSHTSLEVAGFHGFGSEVSAIHVVVARGARYIALPGVRVHESRRFSPSDIATGPGPPRTSAARSAVDAAAWQRWPRYACALLAAVVQQRMCTVPQLQEALASAGQIRHRSHISLALDDIAGGAESLGEIDVSDLCRTYHLALPSRQTRRKDGSGRVRYLDCEWTLTDGSVVVLEIDGSHHLSAEHWEADIKREREVVVGGSRVLRATVVEMRLEAAAVAADLIAVGVPRLAGSSGHPQLVRR